MEPLDAYSSAEPGEVAGLALAAVSRCLTLGRYAEAERLGKLAETLQRMEAARSAARPAAPFDDTDEEEVEEDEETLEEMRAKVAARFHGLALQMDARFPPGTEHGWRPLEPGEAPHPGPPRRLHSIDYGSATEEERRAFFAGAAQ